MTIEFILCSKNDGYCGDPMERLRISLKHNLEILSNFNNWSITVIDWNSDIKIEDVIGITHQNLNFLYVNANDIKEIKSKFSEVHALNYAARLSTADFIARLDQDTMIGPKFLEWFFTNKEYDKDTFYICKRTDLDDGVVTIDGESRPNAGLQWAAWGCAIGVFLIPKHMWLESTGYNESYIHFNHMEIEFSYRLKQKYNYVDLTPIIGYDFYHIHHSRLPDSERTFNPMPNENELQFIANSIEKWGLQ